MLTGPIPDLVDHRKMASQQGEIKGSVSISRLPRLGESLESDAGDVQLDLTFKRGELGQTRLTGTVCANVTLVCQKCLEPYEQTLESSLRVVIVPGEDALASLEEDEDGYLCPDSRLSLIDLLEDELLLSIPMIPRHPGECAGDREDSAETIPADAPEADAETYRPFAGLADALKDNK